MYQLGFNPATTEVPRMSLTAGANRWASKVVIILQLAAWSAVGIVLLQKGVSSMHKAADVRNATQLNNTVTVSNLMMKKIASEEDRSENESSSSSLEGESEEKWNPGSVKSKTYDLGSKIKVIEEGSAEDALPQDKKKPTNNDASKEFTPGHKSGNASETRWNLRTSNIAGGGTAAAAVAMIAVGAVMLVLGPAVILLRTLDDRRQERRFLKLSAQDDLPPSYEQATLMDEAPRYSTLSLNTISGSPSAGGTSAGAPEVCEV
ncbi:uncharacterized protein LOC124407408 isoform X2 [Diprion similis]|uniref:uncharacterized protein LOC124407408 isoform X1 n=1 Tax=Diprion similis TaxID=362088 RepID=UPI001EF8F4EB|nr:uncharacterized protein LOC124407408 isoform X1 [Diprion similis]XP_046739471.1 uncharacterized protein LOC124407408 isoform X2 [Diprion similis]